MTSFSERLKIIPRAAWISALTLFAILAGALWFGPFTFEEEARSWPLWAKVGTIAAGGMILGAYALLVGFIYADARRRQMRHVMWAWLALIPYFVGVILYFILRDPLPTPCPACGTEVAQGFSFCPGCGTSIHPTCSQCGKSLRREWGNCPYCGTRIAAQASAG